LKKTKHLGGPPEVRGGERKGKSRIPMLLLVPELKREGGTVPIKGVRPGRFQEIGGRKGISGVSTFRFCTK